MYIKLRKVFVHTSLNHPVQHNGAKVNTLAQGCANCSPHPAIVQPKTFHMFFEVLDKINVTNKAFWFGLEYHNYFYKLVL